MSAATIRPAQDIDVLCLPKQMTRRLRAHGITTVAELCAKRPADILAVTWFGPDTVREIREVLQTYGLDLRDIDTEAA
ncbi:DNA-directed RNA polymerase subunit alpha C-terminal domain-containing protein [Paraburkholderia sp. EG287A]|uniref:DNA-directed RNA polymerase subunit alpha C-terminal domain-containing protein n=1 Tax=unclassified Paraburkholderia TaxID=2615204 RepID=UPI0034D29CC4